MMRSLTLALAAALAAFAAAAEPPPAAPQRPATDVYHGVTVVDPYRNLEDTKDPEVARWMKAQSDHAHATLRSLPGRQALLERLLALDATVPARIGSTQRAPGGRLFHEKRDAADNQYKLMLREPAGERVLVDPEALHKATGKPHAINWWQPSPDGRRVVYGVSQQGSEAAVLRVLDTTSGRHIGAAVDRADFAAPSWSPDGKTLLFMRLQPMKPGMHDTDKYQQAQVWRWRPGSPIESAKVAFGTRVAGLPVAPADLPFVQLTHDGRWAFGVAYNGTEVEIAGLFVARQADLLAGKPRWKRLFDSRAAVSGFAYFDDTLYLRTHKDAPRSQVLALDLKRPDLTAARLVVPQSERVVTGLGTASDALYLEMRDGNVKRLFKRAHRRDAALEEVALPVQGSFNLAGFESTQSAADPRLPGVLIALESWTRASRIYQVQADGKVVDTGLQPRGPHDAPADVVATEALVKSHDGAMVPTSVIHKKDIALDGSNPTILYGYASYGITEEPFFREHRLAWLERGGVFAVANPRGSGVYGYDWYKAGFQATKPNTWRDFIACAEWLIAQKYTRPDKLGILGGSAGGILVGRAMTERPDLFAAVIPMVGALDGLRFENTANGVPNIPEFGSVKTEAGFRALLAMSTYANIRDGVSYPAVMLTHGVNDPRVEVWQSTKAAARLAAANPNGKPVLLRLDYDAGHGVGSTKQQIFGERADWYSFMLWQMGHPEFQPRIGAKENR